MGGFGATSYAARHPDLFAAAASFSGAVDTSNPLDRALMPDVVFGPWSTQEVRWRAHNPTNLAENLRSLSLTIRTGKRDARRAVWTRQRRHRRVRRAPDERQFSSAAHATRNPEHLWDDYGPGGHEWPYWRRDLRETLPTLMSVFAHPRPAPASFTFAAVEPDYSVYGWSVDLRRRALEFRPLHVNAIAGSR